MAKKQSKRQRDIKTKLMAAICMLLVSSIMMVSSTYAWFTLSTAPEVTGINTAVGANGNLEMALLPKNGDPNSVTSNAGDSSLPNIEDKNVTWGNLVDVSDSTVYGLDQITLYPAELNLTVDGKVDVEGFILKTPKYGADGRVSELAANGQTSYYGGAANGFAPNEEYGVRAVGTVSGMTPRQLSYRNARSAAGTAMKLAANQASATLNTNGSALANIAIKYGMNGTDATFNATDLAALRAMINDLKNNVLGQIETAYMQYILAYAASAANTSGDTVWSAVEGTVKADGATLTSVTAALTGNGITIPAQVQTGIDAYNDIVEAVNNADTKLKTLEESGKDSFTWTEVSATMTPLADPEKIEVNGFLAKEVKDKLGDLISSITSQGGLKVILKSGAGVFADIADQTEDYTASVSIDGVSAGGFTLNDMTARMVTQSSVNPSYLSQVGTAVDGAGAPSGSSDTVMPLSDMYGFIIDLAFRTNAAESNLLLQQKAIDRIYGDNTNEETMGGGASMTFQATTTDFSNDQVKGLMDSIVLVFFNPADGTIFCYGALDTDNATVGADGVTAEIYLYTPGVTYKAATEGATHVEEITYREAAAGETATHISDGAGGYTTTIPEGQTATHVQVKTYREAADGETATHKAVTSTSIRNKITDNKIMALTQNVATALSVLVYLDGNEVTNADVAATGSTSMTGTMNLQFSSSATLVPMDYSDLHIPGGNTEGGENSQTPENP